MVFSLAGLALWRHWAATAHSGLGPFNVVVAKHDFINLKRMTRVVNEKFFPFKDRFREMLASAYIALAIVIVLSSTQINISGYLKYIADEYTKLPEFGFPGKILIPFISIFVVDLLLDVSVAWISARRSSLFFSKQRVADTNVSDGPHTLNRDPVKEDTMSAPPGTPIPLSLEDYQRLSEDPRYAKYLAAREKKRLDESRDIDPTDGGPTGESILAKYLAGRDR